MINMKDIILIIVIALFAMLVGGNMDYQQTLENNATYHEEK